MTGSRAAPSAGKSSRTVFWLLLFVAGSAAGLSLVSAGPTVRYQHYDLPGLAANPVRQLALALLAVQSALVVWLGRSTLREVFGWLRERVGFLRLAAATVVTVLASATLAWPPLLFVAELLLAGTLQLLAIATLLVAVQRATPSLSARAQSGVERLLGNDRAPSMQWRDPVAWTLAIGVTLLCALLAFFVYQRHPHVPDEVDYLFHARYFAQGRLWMPTPNVPAAFDIDLLMVDGPRWYSPVPPGWPAVLAIGVAVGAPWMVNPILAGIGILLAFALVSALYGRRLARLATLLLAASPWYLFMGMNLMTHALTLVCALIAVLGAVRTRQSGRLAPALVGGLACGMASLTRPLEGLAVAMIGGLILLRRPLQRAIAPGAAYVFGAVITGSINLVYNFAMSGNVRVFPIMRYIDHYYSPGANDLGFGANRGLGWGGLDPFPGHGLVDVLINADFNFFAINTELFGWSIGSLTLVTLFLFARRGARTTLDWCVAAAGAIVIGLHTFYWFSGGPDFGARYWYLVIVPAVILTARAVEWLESPVPASRPLVAPAVLFLSCLALATFVPWRAVDKYVHYRGMRPDLRHLADSAGFGRSIVLVRGRRHPDYASASVLNPLDLRAAAPIFVWDRNRDVRSQVLREYSDRPVWIVDGPTRTNGAYKIVRGPLPAGSIPTDPSSDSLANAPR